MQSFYVYILKCYDNSYYTGHTNDLERRLSEHDLGIMDCYTFNRRPVALVYAQECATRDEAFSLERQIKGWSRAKKEALILDNWRLLSCLGKRRSK
jgi:putative endonuclease